MGLDIPLNTRISVSFSSLQKAFRTLEVSKPFESHGLIGIVLTNNEIGATIPFFRANALKPCRRKDSYFEKNTRNEDQVHQG